MIQDIFVVSYNIEFVDNVQLCDIPAVQAMYLMAPLEVGIGIEEIGSVK
jgi:hypothetical protein